jgi:hypothetical protein
MKKASKPTEEENELQRNKEREGKTSHPLPLCGSN